MANCFSSLASSSNSDQTNRERPNRVSDRQNQSSTTPEWGARDSFCNQYGFYQENQKFMTTNQQQQLPLSHQQTPPEHHQPLINRNKIIESQSFQQDPENNKNQVTVQKLSTEQILKLAGERFVQFSSQKFININNFIHPYGSSLAGLCVEDKQDVELAQLLLATAEKVGDKQFDRANKLLNNCQRIASNVGTPVQRAVFYFSEALQERIKKEIRNPEEKNSEIKSDGCYKRNIAALVAMYQQLPFFQILHFTAVQSILEDVDVKQKVHLVDFQIITGLHWAALIQAMAERKMDSGGYLKITAIEAVDKDSAERAGELLKGFARHLNLPFSDKVVFLSDIKDLKEEDLDIKPDKYIGILFNFYLRTLISKPICLKNMMAVTQKIKPSIVVVGEVEANHNSPTFVSRFIEALFFYGAMFDSLEGSMARDNTARLDIESGTFREGINNVVAAEGYERVTRSVSISVWRAFFARFGLMEMEISTSSLYQACLIVKQFPSGDFCTLDVSNKCLMVGWRGTPLFSLSAWKFQ